MFSRKIAVNHHLCERCAAFHKAKPFHGSVHTTSSASIHGFIPATPPEVMPEPRKAFIEVIIPKVAHNAISIYLGYNACMRYLGIDFGSKRVGVALSDAGEQFAFPYGVLQNTPTLLSDIQKICAENEVGAIVVGESKNFKMENNTIMEEVLPFVEKLKTLSALPVYIHPEFMTSEEAGRLQGKNDMLDASAASLILKSFLDTKTHHDNIN